MKLACDGCGEKQIEVRFKPHLPFADLDGNITLPCRVCDKDTWDACEEIFGVLKKARLV